MITKQFVNILLPNKTVFVGIFGNLVIFEIAPQNYQNQTKNNQENKSIFSIYVFY